MAFMPVSTTLRQSVTAYRRTQIVNNVKQAVKKVDIGEGRRDESLVNMSHKNAGKSS